MPERHAPVTVQLIAGIRPGCTGGVGGHLYLTLGAVRRPLHAVGRVEVVNNKRNRERGQNFTLPGNIPKLL